MRSTHLSADPSAGDLVVVSNRGPAQLWRGPDGKVVSGRARGGLASSLANLLSGASATWICAAMGEAEREIVEAGDAPGSQDGIRLHMVVPDGASYAMAYQVVSNAVLWYAYHDLFDKVRRPSFGAQWETAWSAYREVNRLFAEKVAMCATPGASILVQDYHLHLVGRYLKESRPDLAVVHFVHTPFCDPSVLGVLPDAAAGELISSMANFDACGFHSTRWRNAFIACCESLGVPPPATFAAPLGVDEAPLAQVAASAECLVETERICSAVGKRLLIVRVDRVEPSKNIVRGFLAFDRMLETHPELRGKVTFLALAYPSRESLAEYRAYRAEMETVAARVNARWVGSENPPGPAGSGLPDWPGLAEDHGGSSDIGLSAAEQDAQQWHPIILEVEDYFPRSVAAMSLYDVLLVNPVRDGLNLVAKEGPLVNTRDGVVVLSRQAGVWDEMEGKAIGINPFDIAATAEAMASGLLMDGDARATSAKAIWSAARKSQPSGWLDAQLAAARRP